MRRTKTTAKPIKIAPSNSNGNSSDDDNRDEHIISNGRKGFIVGKNRCDELNSEMGGMTVGSLPCVRRGRRSVVSSCGNEILYGGHAGHRNGNLWTQNQRQGKGRPNREMEMLATSMPVPHAPYLSSRRDYESSNKLSSFPAINLTMSAAGSIEPESMTYGSLRESIFTRLNANSLNYPTYISDSTADKSGCIAQSLPRMRNCNDNITIHNDIGVSLETEGRGGIASLFDGGDSTQSGPGTASGAIAHDCLHDEERILNSNSNSNIGNSSPQYLERTREINSADLIGNINENNGMGSILDNRDYVPNEVNTLNNNEDIPSGSRLGTSLTGLDILRSSQPGLVDLTPEQRESLQKRVRVMGSYDGPVSQSLSLDITPSSTVSFRNPPKRLQGNTNASHPILSGERQSPLTSLLIPPRNMMQAIETEDLDGYDDMPPSSPDDIFDMDE